MYYYYGDWVDIFDAYDYGGAYFGFYQYGFYDYPYYYMGDYLYLTSITYGYMQAYE